MPSDDDPSDHGTAMTSDSGELLPWLWSIETLAEENWCDASILQACIDRVPNFWDEASDSIREKVILRYLRELLNSGVFGSSQSLPLDSDSREVDNVPSSEVLCRLLLKASSLCNPTKGMDKGKERSRGHWRGKDFRRYIRRKSSDLPRSSLDLLKKSSVEGHSKLLLSLKESISLGRLNKANNQDCDIGTEQRREIQMLKMKEPCIAPDPANLIPQEDSTRSRQHLPVMNCMDGDGREQSHRNISSNCCENVQLSRHDSLPQILSKENSGTEQAPLDVSRVNHNPLLHEKRHFDGDQIVSIEMDNDDDADGYRVVPTNLCANADKAASISVDLDPMVDDWTEKHLCVKCNKDGPMFNCSDHSCLMAVHEKCLGTSPYFDERGLYYCPPCSYKMATTAYRKAKLRMLQTREALSAFLGKDSIQDKLKGTVSAGVPREVNQPGVTVDLEKEEASKVSYEGAKGDISCADLVFRRSGYETVNDHIESMQFQSHNAAVTHAAENDGTNCINGEGEVPQKGLVVEKGQASKVSCVGDEGDTSCADFVFRRSGGETANDHIESMQLQSHNATVTHAAENDDTNCINERDAPHKDFVVEENHHRSKQLQPVNTILTPTADNDGTNSNKEERDAPQKGLVAEENDYGSRQLQRTVEDGDTNNINGERDVSHENFVAEENQYSEPAAENDNSNLACQDLNSVQTRNEHMSVALKGKQHNEDNQNTVNMLRDNEPPEIVMNFRTENTTDPGSSASPTSAKHAKRRKLDLEMEKNHPPCVTAKAKEETKLSSDNRNKRHTRNKRYFNPILPVGRRTRLHWTAEEEEILKTAVQKFANDGEKTLPWTKILDFGRHIFHKTRQPGDLKDKWRNIRNKEASKGMER